MSAVNFFHNEVTTVDKNEWITPIKSLILNDILCQFIFKYKICHEIFILINKMNFGLMKNPLTYLMWTFWKVFVDRRELNYDVNWMFTIHANSHLIHWSKAQTVAFFTISIAATRFTANPTAWFIVQSIRALY